MVPAGSFTMGSPAREPDRKKDEGPQHRVTIGRDFAAGKYEVTRGEYAAFVREPGRAPEPGWYYSKDGDWQEGAKKSWRDPGFRVAGTL